MRRTYSERRNQVGQANMQVQEAERSGKLVAQVNHVSHSFGQQQLVRDFSAVILRGEKISIIGPNGAGKTTLLQIVLGQLAPQSGEVRHGTKLEVAYFDQLRKPVSDDVTAIDVIGDGKEYLEIGGQARHVIGYLQDFLFTPDRARQPVRSLSGGERARLLLAQMFSKPSNVLVLDEPTNDLDIETLDLLEERLMEYTGTVLLVSHDREFINHIATRSWVIEGEGHIGDYVGGFEDWMRQRTSDPWANLQKPEKTADSLSTAQAPATLAVTAPVAAPVKKRKLSFKDQRELDALPALIETLEKQQTALAATIGAANFYQQDKDTVAKTQAEVSKVDVALEKAYARWEALEGPADE